MTAATTTAATIMMWLTFAAIATMIVAYALERWSIEVISIASVVGWLLLFWLVPMIIGEATPLTSDQARYTRLVTGEKQPD
jgi:hypothetical protein